MLRRTLALVAVAATALSVVAGAPSVASAQAANVVIDGGGWGHGRGLSQWGSLGYTWAPIGQQPVVKTTGRRKAYKVFGLIELFSGRLFYQGIDGRFNGPSYVAFLTTVLEQTTQPQQRAPAAPGAPAAPAPAPAKPAPKAQKRTRKKAENEADPIRIAPVARSVNAELTPRED